MIATTRQQRRALKRENLRWPDTLREIPRNEWPNAGPPRKYDRLPPHKLRLTAADLAAIQNTEEPNDGGR